MISQFKALLGLADRASQQFEYWREYKGQEVWIRDHSLERKETERGPKYEQTSYVIKGTVADVMSFPPGFLLEDVEEILIQSDFELVFGMGAIENLDIPESHRGEEVVREIEKKFVSFDSISQLERGDWVENAKEPFREVREDE